MIMALDLNDAASYGRDDYSNDVVSAALRLIAYKWVPEMFPNGIIGEEGGCRSLRVADIKGRRPRDRGSCRIWLTGDHAGDWVDFERPETLKGQPLSTIKEHLGLADGEVKQVAIELIQRHGGDLEGARGHAVNGNGHANGNGKASSQIADKRLAQAHFYWDSGQPCPGTYTETYWQARNLGNLPPCAFTSPSGDPDMLFVAWATNYDLNRGVPTIVHRFRYPDGTITGAVHLTHLKEDGSWHLGKGTGKKTWGPRQDGGVIMLAPISAEGTLGIGEGIESTAAGMLLFPGVPGWATCGTAAMHKFGEWLITAPASQKASIKRLLLWGDAGKGGERTLHETADLARQAGIPQVETYLPGSGDDLAADLMQGLPAPAPILDHVPMAPGLPFGGNPVADIDSRLMALDKASEPAAVQEVCRLIAAADMSPLDYESRINSLFRKTGLSKKTIGDTIKRQQAEIIRPVGVGIPTKPWGSKFALGNDGDPKGIMSNVAIVLREASEIKGAFAQNDFTGMIHVLRKLPWEPGAGNPCDDRIMADADELACLEWIQTFAGIHSTRGAAFDAIQRVSTEHCYHPVKEYLYDTYASWDRVPRIENGAVSYFGAKDTLYNREVFKRWIISAVARVLKPGIKADCMLVFEGPQGLGKSTAVRILFDPNNAGWFTDQLAEMGTKDASLELRGIWCAEYSDLHGMTNAEARVIKSYMSRMTDRFRPPYGRFPIKVDRQNIFAGTTNEIEYLKDATGARRFWPLRCTSIDRAGLFRDKENIWGEAVALFLGNLAKWWIDEQTEPDLAAEAARITDARYQGDAWEAVVRRWLINNGRSNITTDEIMHDALEIHDKAKWSRNDQIRVGYLLRRMKWVRARDMHGAREWRYWRPGTLDPTIAEADEG